MDNNDMIQHTQQQMVRMITLYLDNILINVTVTFLHPPGPGLVLFPTVSHSDIFCKALAAAFLHGHVREEVVLFNSA